MYTCEIVKCPKTTRWQNKSENGSEKSSSVLLFVRRGPGKSPGIRVVSAVAITARGLIIAVSRVVSRYAWDYSPCVVALIRLPIYRRGQIGRRGISGRAVPSVLFDMRSKRTNARPKAKGRVIDVRHRHLRHSTGTERVPRDETYKFFFWTIVTDTKQSRSLSHPSFSTHFF